ncbi:hypothetical protein AAG906_017781 [Vitis piasezkii]
MDLWCAHIKNPNLSPLLLRNSFSERPFSCYLAKVGSFRPEDGRLFEIRVASRKASSLVVRAMGKKNHDNSSSSGNGDRSIPEGDSLKGNNPSEGNKSNDTASQKSRQIIVDWREFRAALFAREQAEKADPEAHSQGGTPQEPKPLGLKWAHPIPVPETGCVLVATEKLDGVRSFERTVVLLLRSGTRHPQEGPFGVVINRPLHKKIKHMKPTNLDLATTFADCSLHFGGPLEASMFLLKTGENPKLPGLEEVIPGLCYGARNSLDEAAKLVKQGCLSLRISDSLLDMLGGSWIS